MSDEPKRSLALYSYLVHRLALLILFVALALFGFLTIRNLIDFPVYYAAGQSLINGRTDLYSPDFALGGVMDYRYPPFFLLAFVPLWLLPYYASAYTWYVLSVLEIIGIISIVDWTFPAIRTSKKMLVLLILAVAQYFVMALHYGNVHILVTFMLFASLYLFLKNRILSAAMVLALTISIKLTPVFLLPYFALKKQWKLLGAVVVFLVAINLAPSAYFGFSRNNDLLATWYRHVVSSQEFHEDNGPINLSLKGQLRRYLSAVNYTQRADGDVRYPDVNLASLSRARLVGLWMVMAAALFAGVLLIIWSRAGGSSKRNDRLDSEAGTTSDLPHEMALMICLMLMVEPLTSKIYFIALLWPVACLASYAVVHNTQDGRLAGRTLAIVAVTNCVLPLLPGSSVQRLLLVLGADFYVNCLVMTALTILMISRRRALPTQSGELQTRSRLGARTP
ncbi:MAG: glycosyltransferase family 87 protein [Blastocatellia bacterium]